MDQKFKVIHSNSKFEASLRYKRPSLKNNNKPNRKIQTLLEGSTLMFTQKQLIARDPAGLLSLHRRDPPWTRSFLDLCVAMSLSSLPGSSLGLLPL